jgi:demethylmenaquinone methyltransferase/2-methoxy-6-polyprenyl-1,4-benzoquinol methylase
VNNPQDKLPGDTTHFGFETVARTEKVKRVGEVFHSVAGKYDLMNDLMSMGVHRLWKRFMLEVSGVRSGQRVLDLAAGTGDISMLFSDRVGAGGLVVMSDINDSMLGVGRDRVMDRGYAGNIRFALANAEKLPFAANSFDIVSIGFGLRNVTDKDAALAEMHRVLKPGGRVLVLEFSKPTFEPLSRLYDLYSFTLLPKIGRAVTGDEDSYRYLAESIRMHPDQQTLRGMMEKAGLVRCDFFNMTAGIVAVHRGFKA